MLSNHYVNFTATSLVLHGGSFLSEFLGPVLINSTMLTSVELTLAPGLHREWRVYY